MPGAQRDMDAGSATVVEEDATLCMKRRGFLETDRDPIKNRPALGNKKRSNPQSEFDLKKAGDGI